MAQDEPQTSNVLVWVGSNGPPNPGEDQTTADWLGSRQDARAVPVLPRDTNPDRTLPGPLRNRHAVWWTGDADQAALSVLSAAEVLTSDRRVFVSYSHADGMELAHAVSHTLFEAGFSVFLDSFSLVPGADFAKRLYHELLDKTFLVLIETPEAVASDWVLKEFAFARSHRMGIAAVWPGGGPQLAGIGRERRWLLPADGRDASYVGDPRLTQPAADDLRRFMVRLHGDAMLRRQHALDDGLRASLRWLGVADSDVVPMPGGLDINAGGQRWAVSLRPRPAALMDMHAAARGAPVSRRPVMVSATPSGEPESEALRWLSDESSIPHWDEADLLSLARGIVSGQL